MLFLKQLWRDVQRVPAPTVLGLIVLMAVIFLFEEAVGVDFQYLNARPVAIVNAWSRVCAGEANIAQIGVIATLVTAVFLHGGFEHLLMNMVFLWAFASLASELLGKWHVVWIFLVTGVAGNILQVCLVPDSYGILGASGAVTGFAGVYIGLASRWRLNWPHVWPLAHPISPMRLAVFALVGVGFDVNRLINGAIGVAFGAHIGGFLCGLLVGFAFTFLKKNPHSRRVNR